MWIIYDDGEKVVYREFESEEAMRAFVAELQGYVIAGVK